MTPDQLDQAAGAISACDALASITAEMIPAGRACWDVRPTSRPDLLVRAGERDGFLCLSLGLGATRAEEWWRFLTANRTLGGLAKFALRSSNQLSVQAELPLLDSLDLIPRLEGAVAGLAAGLAVFGGGNGANNSAADADGGGEIKVMDLSQLCAEAGWAHLMRKDGRCSVALETLRGSYTAFLGEQGGRIHATCQLVSVEELTPVSRQAIACCLLRTSSLVRMARASAMEDEAGSIAQMEVVFDLPPTGQDLGSGLGALSVGCDLCASQVELLQEEAPAHHFLESRGGPRDE